MRHVDCERCGKFDACDQDGAFAGYEIPDGTRHLLSAFLRRRFEETGRRFTIEDRKGKAFPSEFVEPTVVDKIGRALLLVASRSKSFGDVVSVTPYTDWPLVSAHGASELERLVDHLTFNGMLDTDSPGRSGGQIREVAVSGKGWLEVDRLRPLGGAGRQAFVAMSFHPDLVPAFEVGIHPALKYDCNYEPMHVGRQHPEGKIDDFVFAEIRRSRLLVADITQLRPSVVMEAGFALGLGIPVIWSCRSGEDFDQLQKHLFDARQYPFLVWNDPDELRRLLRERIQARFPLAMTSN